MNRMLTLCALLLLTASLALAAPPRTLNYQGTLTDNTGLPVSDGNYTLTFRLWDSSVGGTSVWSEAQSVNVTGGVFNAILGLVNTLNVDFEDQLFLGVQVGVDPELAPRTPMTSVPSAFNVVDGAAVTSLNGRTDDVNIVAGANINVSTSGQNIVISGTGVVTDADWAVSGGDMTSIPGGNVGIGAAPSSKLDVNGIVRSSTATGGDIQVRVSGSGTYSSLGGDHFGAGSAINLYNANGNVTTEIEPDISGVGGYVRVFRNATSAGLVLDGNAGGTENPRLTISGDASSFIVDGGDTGNASVVMPVDAVSDSEIENEAGVASRVAYGTSSYGLGTSLGTLTSRTITCPTDGYVLVTATYETDLNMTGSAIFSTIGVSDSFDSLPNNQDNSTYLPGTAGNGTYLIPCASSAVFPVTAGSHTFYLNGRKSSTTADIQVWDVQLSVLFVPTAYGSVSIPAADLTLAEQDRDAPSLPGPTAGDLAAERAESEQVVRDRVADELAAMRDRIAALERELVAQNEK